VRRGAGAAWQDTLEVRPCFERRTYPDSHRQSDNAVEGWRPFACVAKDDVPVLTQLKRNPFVYYLAVVSILAFFVFRSKNSGILLDPLFFHADEGLNLMKGMLLHNGYQLYSQIWSDQPPFLTQLFSLLYGFFGNEVTVYRAFVLGLFLLSVALFVDAQRDTYGLWFVLAASIGLGLSETTINFAVLANVGLPSISLALISIAVLSRDKEERPFSGRFLAAAILMGLAVATKVWVVVALLATLLQILLGSGPRRRVARALTYGAVATFVFTLIVALSTDDLVAAVKQLILPHYAMRLDATYPSLYERVRMDGLELLSIAALLSALLMLLFRRGFLLLPFWYLLAWLFFFDHRPSWEHHVLMIQVPAAFLFGVSVSELVSVARGSRRLVNVLYILPVMLFVAYYSQQTFASQDYRSADGRYFAVDSEVLALVEGYAGPGRFLFTDTPYHAFILNAEVPPKLAVFSRKRLESGHLDVQHMAALVDAYDVQVVWLDRFSDTLAHQLMAVVNSPAHVFERVYAERPNVVYVNDRAFAHVTANSFEDEEDIASLRIECRSCDADVDATDQYVVSGLRAAEVRVEPILDGCEPCSEREALVSFAPWGSEAAHGPVQWLRVSVLIPAETFQVSDAFFVLRGSEDSGTVLSGLEIERQGVWRLPSEPVVQGLELADRWITVVTQYDRFAQRYRVWVNALPVAEGPFSGSSVFAELSFVQSTPDEYRFYLDGIYSGAYPESIGQSESLLFTNAETPAWLSSELQQLFPSSPKIGVRPDKTLVVGANEILDGNGRTYLWDGDARCLPGASKVPSLVLEEGAVLRNLTLQNLSGEVRVAGDGVTIDGVTFVDPCGDGVVIEQGQGTRILSSRFYGCRSKGVKIDSDRAPLIAGNRFLDCAQPVWSSIRLSSEVVDGILEENHFWKAATKFHGPSAFFAPF
jgi:hypothetical protein